MISRQQQAYFCDIFVTVANIKEINWNATQGKATSFTLYFFDRYKLSQISRIKQNYCSCSLKLQTFQITL